MEEVLEWEDDIFSEDVVEDPNLLIRKVFQEARLVNSEGKMKSTVFSNVFDDICFVNQWSPAPLNREEIISLMRIPFTESDDMYYKEGE